MVAEGGPGQWEITVSPKYGIEAVDNAYRFKNCIKEIARAHNHSCTFMTKPYAASNSGAHFNHSLWETESGRNAFFDEAEKYNMSKIAKHWVAGLQHHARGLMALLCPTVNCYRRVVPNNWVPINNTWGFENRTASLRFKSHGANATFLENRVPSSACNPYLVAAAVIIAGIDGIDKEMLISDEMKGTNHDQCPTGTKSLPVTLEEAILSLKKDDMITKEFGEEFIKQFSLTKELEIQGAAQAECGDRLLEWERNLYWTYI